MSTNHFHGYHEIVHYPNDRHIVIYANDEATDYPTHWHTPLELLMPTHNTYTAYIGNKKLELEPYNILLVAPNAYHSYIAPQWGRRYFILADVSVLSNVLGLNQILSLIGPAALFTAENAPGVHPRLKELFLGICDTYFNQEPLHITRAPEDGQSVAPTELVDLLEPVIYSKLMEMLTLAAQNNAAHWEEPAFPNKPYEYVNKMTMVCNYIDAHCTEGLSLETMSQMINFSKYHFSRLFKEFTHESFYRYVNRKRIQYAERLLLQQKLSVTETALSSGYSNTSSFIRMFKSINGCTPGEFKNRHAQSLLSSPDEGDASPDAQS